MRELGSSFAFGLIVVFAVSGACSSSGPGGQRDSGGTAGTAGQGGGGGGSGQGGGSGEGGNGGQGGDGGQTIDPQCGPPVPSLLAACGSYCNVVATNCTDANAQFTGFDACLSQCTAPTWSCGTPGDQSGNTVLCRLQHATSAQLSPDTECAAAGPNSPACL